MSAKPKKKSVFRKVYEREARKNFEEIKQFLGPDSERILGKTFLKRVAQTATIFDALSVPAPRRTNASKKP